MIPKKHLGQNFLRDKNILRKIIESADLTADDFVVEIGPGEGVLTTELVKHAKKVLAIEIDNSLATNLKKRFEKNKKIEIINADILKINLPEIIKTNFANSQPAPSPVLIRQLADGHPLPGTGEEDNEIFFYKVIANIPYYITSPIIRLFLETKYPPTEMILMVQREVAERICALPGNMSILAVGVQYYAQPELLFNVPKNAFYPVPEVDSAVIRITPHDLTPNPSPSKGEGSFSAKNFFRLVKAGFSAKRKTLINNLASSLQLDKKELEEKLKNIGLKANVRAQELSVSDWKKLTQELEKNNSH